MERSRFYRITVNQKDALQKSRLLFIHIESLKAMLQSSNRTQTDNSATRQDNLLCNELQIRVLGTCEPRAVAVNHMRAYHWMRAGKLSGSWVRPG